MLILQGEKPSDDWIYLPEPISGVTLKLTGLQDGAYLAHWYSPRQGTWLSQQPVSVVGGTLTVQLPEFQGDLAIKVLPAR